MARNARSSGWSPAILTAVPRLRIRSSRLPLKHRDAVHRHTAGDDAAETGCRGGACPEEIAYLNGFIDADQLELLGKKLGKSTYGKYLLSRLKDGKI
jgi:hypothetical protein